MTEYQDNFIHANSYIEKLLKIKMVTLLQVESLQFCDFGIIKIADWFLNTLLKDECHFQVRLG